MPVGANRNERESERAMSASDAGRRRSPKEGSEVHAGEWRRAAKGGVAEDAAEGSTEQADSLEGGEPV